MLLPVKMKLYAYRYCPYSRRVRIALAEHECDFEYVEQSPKDPYPEELKGKVPGDHGVPVLFVREDFVLWDSVAIMHWLDSSYPRSLYPSAREPQAIARAWQSWFASKLYPALRTLRDGDARAKKKAEETILKHLRSIEGMIGEDWMVGGVFSIADVAVAPAFAELSSDALQSLPPRVREYAGRVRARPSVREVCELDLPAEHRPSFAA